MTKTVMIRFIILGLLSHDDLSGYDIKKKFDDTISLFWGTATLSQIYPILQLLEDNGFVRKRVVPDVEKKRPPKKIYSLTKRGKKEFQTQLKSPIDIHSQKMFQIIQEQILRFYLVDSLTKKESLEQVDIVSKYIAGIIETIELQKQNTKDELRCVETLEEKQALRYRLYALDLLLSLCRKHSEWSSSTLRRIKLLPKAK